MTYEQLSAKEADDPIIAPNYITAIEGQLNFTTDIVASVNDAERFQGTYWSESVMHWSFNGNGTVTKQLVWEKGRGGDDGKVVPEKQWTMQSSPTKVDTSGDIANAEARKYEYYEPNLKKKP